jgi:hypothetical protein
MREFEAREAASISGVAWLNGICSNRPFAPNIRLILESKTIPE